MVTSTRGNPCQVDHEMARSRLDRVVSLESIEGYKERRFAKLNLQRTKQRVLVMYRRFIHENPPVQNIINAAIHPDSRLLIQFTRL